MWTGGRGDGCNMGFGWECLVTAPRMVSRFRHADTKVSAVERIEVELQTKSASSDNDSRFNADIFFS